MADGSVVIDTKLDNSSLKNGFKKIGNIASTALKGMTIAVGTVTTAFAGLVTASVNARGEIEQQIGGVETLFKNNADKVIKNAENAYKTAGMSATQYMQTVTSFSASLLQSLSGDTSKAADIADMALRDMSDNANKFGTDMEAIQNAYQGFAKQNYTMLDNLKLGYGGTKTEMERLLKDAQKLTGIKYDINNLSDVYNAIHAVQEELGVTGTTAKEATSTLQGSFASMKASWENFLSGSGNLSQVVETVTDVVGNIGRIVSEAIPSIIENITNSLPKMLELGKSILQNLLSGIQENFPQITQTAITIIQTLLQTFLEMLPQILEMGITLLVELIKGISQMIPELIPMAINCIITLVETLIDNLDMIIDAGIELIIALIEGIFNALPDLIAKLPELIMKIAMKLIELIVVKIPQVAIRLVQSLIEGLFSYWNKMLSKIQEFFKGTIFEGFIGKVADMAKIGLQFIQGLWNGINDAKNWIWNKISGFCDGIVNSIKNFFGIHSPSRLFRDEIGQYLGLGLGEGFEDSLSGVYKNMRKAVDYENAKLTSNLTNTHQINLTNEDNKQARLESIDNNKEIVVKAETNLDGKVLTSTVNRVNAKQKLQYGIA